LPDKQQLNDFNTSWVYTAPPIQSHICAGNYQRRIFNLSILMIPLSGLFIAQNLKPQNFKN